jgi:molybdate transport system ATP-binding protein
MLDADIKLRLDRLNLDAAVSVAAGEVLALLGPNGAGKSTVLRALAGLLRLTDGQVALDGVVLEDPARRIRVAPEKRPVAMMFQDYLLFPHLSAVENVAFGLRARGVGRRQARERARSALERLDVSKLASARPGAMSGGQQQRVAMARALVTHDLLDAVALADRMLVTEDGAIVQSGTPAVVAPAAVAVYRERPAAAGVNVWPGRVGTVDLLGDRVRVRVDGTPPITAEVLPHDVDRLKLDDGGALWASVEPSAVRVYPP